MRTETKTITLYQLSELSDSAKDRAISDWRNATDYVELSFFNDECVDNAKEAGFDNAKVQYSLGYCQGDGVSFSAEIDVKKFILLARPNMSHARAQIIASNCQYVSTGNSGRYCFAHKNDVDLYLDSNKNMPNIEAVVSDALSIIEDAYMDLCRDFEKDGYAEIENQNSDEYITDTLEANNYEFTEDGERN